MLEFMFSCGFRKALRAVKLKESVAECRSLISKHIKFNGSIRWNLALAWSVISNFKVNSWNSFDISLENPWQTLRFALSGKSKLSGCQRTLGKKTQQFDYEDNDPSFSLFLSFFRCVNFIVPIIRFWVLTENVSLRKLQALQVRFQMSFHMFILTASKNPNIILATFPIGKLRDRINQTQRKGEGRAPLRCVQIISEKFPRTYVIGWLFSGVR